MSEKVVFAATYVRTETLKLLKEGSIREIREYVAKYYHDDEADTLIAKYGCEYGRLDVIEWLIDEHLYKHEDGNVDYIPSLQYACKYDQIEIIEWIVKEFDLDVDSIRDDDPYPILNRICDSGGLKALRWIVEYFTIDREVFLEENGLLCGACENGQFENVKYLAEKLEITIDDVKEYNYGILRACCFGGEDLTQWFIDRFDITLDDTKIIPNPEIEIFLKSMNWDPDRIRVCDELGPKFAGKMT